MTCTDVNFMDICRTCKANVFEMISIFTKTTSPPIDEMLMSLVSFKPVKNDGLPSKICKECLVKLQSLFDFRQQALQNDLEFRKMLSLNSFNKNISNNTGTKQSTNETIIELTCHKCDTHIGDQQMLEKHMKDKHLQILLYECKICGLRIDRNEVLKKHLSLHLKNLPYLCAKCKSNFNTTEEFKIHKDLCLLQSYICEHCERGFMTEESLKSHQVFHDNKTRQQDITIADLENYKEYFNKVEEDYEHNSTENVGNLTVKLENYEVGEDNDGPAETTKSLIEMDKQISTTSCKNKTIKHLRSSKIVQSSNSQTITHEVEPLIKIINPVNHVQINMSQSSEEPDEVYLSEKDDSDADYRPNIKISQKKTKPKSGRGPGRPKKVKRNEPNKTEEENTLKIDYNKYVKEREARQYKKKIYSCNLCDFTCTNNIKRHMATHLIEKPHVCVKCNRTFARHDKLLRHERTCQGKPIIICEACNKAFELESELNEHLNTEVVTEKCHGSKKSKTISLENYSDPERLSKFYSFYFETENPVELTNEVIQNNSQDSGIMVQVNSDSDVIDVVGNLSQSYDDYTPKVKATRGRKKRKVGRPRKQRINNIEDEIEPEGHYPCPVCSEVFTKMTDLEMHGREVHVDYQVLKCPAKCDAMFSRVYAVKRHMKMHAIDAGEQQKDEESHLCGRCQRKFTTAKALKFHMRKHEAEDSFVCSKCAKPFNSKTNLVEHMKFHAPERKFLCSICGLGFVRNDYLIIHMRRHRGDKPYACQYCGKGFARQTDVKIHERYHTGEKTHLCTVCGRGFARAYSLNVHMRIHTGEKPYECMYCDAAFAQSNDLKSHVRRHTGERFQCDLCAANFIMGYELIQHKRRDHGLNIVSHIRRLKDSEAQQAEGLQLETVKLPKPIIARPPIVFTEIESKI